MALPSPIPPKDTQQHVRVVCATGLGCLALELGTARNKHKHTQPKRTKENK